MLYKKHNDGLNDSEKAYHHTAVASEKQIVDRRREIYYDLQKQYRFHVFLLHHDYRDNARDNTDALRYVKLHFKLPIQFVIFEKGYSTKIRSCPL